MRRFLLTASTVIAMVALAVLGAALSQWLATFSAGRLLLLALMAACVVHIGVNAWRMYATQDEEQA